MSRSALRLAALASSAVPGLDPVSVVGVPVRPGDRHEVAFVTDSLDREWVVRVARTAAAGALLEDVGTLLPLLARRLEVAVPVIRGVSAGSAGRAVVHARVPGVPLDFAALPPAAALTADVGRTLAHIHDIDRAVFEEAGRPTYDAETHRKRLLSELDRASTSGHVPPGLLARWEHRLEDVSRWRFAPTPVHGSYAGSHVLAGFADQDDAGSGRVLGVVGWEQARVGDPADDFAELVGRTDRTALDTVLEAYTQSRTEPPDPNLPARARLAAEMSLVHRLLAALSAGETRLVEHASARLQELDERIREAEELARAERLEAERAAMRERHRARLEAAAQPSVQGVEVAAAGRRPEDEATQPFAPPSARLEPEPGGLRQADAALDPPGDASLGEAPHLAERSPAGAPAATASPSPTGPSPSSPDRVRPDEDGDAVDDRHEGASHFVTLQRRGPRGPGPDA